MVKSVNREKINPLFACMKGGHPTWDDAEECRANWRKYYGERILGYIDGEYVTKVRHRPKAKKKSISRKSIRHINVETEIKGE